MTTETISNLDQLFESAGVTENTLSPAEKAAHLPNLLLSFLLQEYSKALRELFHFIGLVIGSCIFL